MNGGMRTRWAAIGAAVAVSLGGGAWWVAHAAAPTAPSRASFVPIAPCRLTDTRPAPKTVGPRSTPIGAGETYSPAVWGSHGNCSIPTTATGVSLNVTAVGGSAPSYLTVFPADVSRPTVSNVNFVAGTVVPNAVTVGLSATGAISVYNAAGTVNVIIDIAGYYTASSPTNVITVAAKGGDFTTVGTALDSITASDTTHRYLISVAPGTYTETGPLQLKSFVDIQGSGQGITTITCDCGAEDNPDGFADSAFIRGTGALVTEVRDLTIVNDGGAATWATGVRFDATPATMRLTRVTVKAIGDHFTAAVSVVNEGTPVLDGVTADAASADYAFSVRTWSAAPSLTNSTMVATAADGYAYGLTISSGTPTPVAAMGLTTEIVGGHATGVNVSGSSTLLLDSAVISVTAGATGGHAKGVAINGARLDAHGVTIRSVSDGNDSFSNAYGFYSEGEAAVTVVGAEVSATSTFQNAFGVYNNDTGVVADFSQTTIRAIGANSYGMAIYNAYGTATYTNVSATGSGSGSYGLVNAATSVVIMRSSFVSGATAGVQTDVTANARIFNSTVRGTTTATSCTLVVAELTATLLSSTCT